MSVVVCLFVCFNCEERIREREETITITITITTTVTHLTMALYNFLTGLGLTEARALSAN